MTHDTRIAAAKLVTLWIKPLDRDARTYLAHPSAEHWTALQESVTGMRDALLHVERASRPGPSERKSGWA